MEINFIEILRSKNTKKKLTRKNQISSRSISTQGKYRTWTTSAWEISNLMKIKNTSNTPRASFLKLITWKSLFVNKMKHGTAQQLNKKSRKHEQKPRNISKISIIPLKCNEFPNYCYYWPEISTNFNNSKPNRSTKNPSNQTHKSIVHLLLFCRLYFSCVCKRFAVYIYNKYYYSRRM